MRGPSLMCHTFQSAIVENERIVTYRQVLVHTSGGWQSQSECSAPNHDIVPHKNLI